MKKYNVKNYVRYKEDLKSSMPEHKEYLNEAKQPGYTRDELIIKFLPLVENIARKFSTTQQASGVLSINDLIQEGSIGLIASVDRLDWNTLVESEDIEKTLKSFLSKRIKGAIRRAIDINRGDMRIPEHALNEIRKNTGKDKKIVETFFNQIFLSFDDFKHDEDSMEFDIEDKTEPYNLNLLNAYLLSLMKQCLNEKEYEVIRLSYGLDCDKHSAKQIANKLGIVGLASYVRVSQIKRDGINKLIETVDPNQVIDYL